MTVGDNQTVRPGVPVGPATPDQIQDAINNMPPVGPIGPGDDETPVVVIVVEPKEALQEGDKFKTETGFQGTSNTSTPNTEG